MAVVDVYDLERKKISEAELRDEVFDVQINKHVLHQVVVSQALTHRSFFSDEAEGGRTNERLEFLGDAVLGMVVTDELYNKFPYKDEGELTLSLMHI